VIAKKRRDALVRVAELTAVALVEDENDPFVPQLFHLCQILRLADGGVQLLQGGDDQFGVVGELLHQLAGVVGAVHAAFAEAVELLDRLVIQVLPVHAEHHLIHARQAGDDLRRFEGRERLAAAGGVPDVAVRIDLRRMDHPFHDLHRGVELIRAQHHQDLVRLVEHRVFADHSAEVLSVQEGGGEGGQLADRLVVRAGPVKRLLEGLFPGVGVILRVHPVADHEELHEVEQPLRAPVTVLLVALDLVERLLHLQPAPFQLDLHQWQAVDEDGHVVAVFVSAAIHGHLLRHLIAVPQWIHRVEEFQIDRGPVLLRQLHPVPQDLGFFENPGAFGQMVQHPGELPGRQSQGVEGFQLRLQVRQHGCLIRHRYLIVA